MCPSISSNQYIATNCKRSYAQISMMSHFVAAPIQSKRQRMELKAPVKSVSFCHQVNLRCIFPNNANPQENTWIDTTQLRQMKDEARRLAKSHYVLHNIKNEPQEDPTKHPARYEMKGESLRGMEHITDLPMGKLRQASKAEANKSVGEEQCRQLLVHTLASFSHGAMVPTNAFSIDRAQLSKVYKEKTREALAYSRQLAEEDAREAAEILAQDL